LASKSAEKQARVASRRQQRNKSARSEVKTDIIRAEKLIFAGELKEAQEAVNKAISDLDKAAEKKILHANNVARRKARLLKKLNQAIAQSKAEPIPEPEPEPEPEEAA
jgi:small subunit ribosomal protein S20